MTIQRHFILFILSLLVIAPSIAHQKPYVINFARDKYHAANKNWAIGQDEKGITYFVFITIEQPKLIRNIRV